MSHSPQHNSAHRKHSGSAAKRNNPKSAGADIRQVNPWHDLDLMELSLPTDDLFGERRRPKAAKGTRQTKRRKKKRKELGGSNVLREDGRQWPRPVRSEMDYRHQDKNTYRGRQISKYNRAESQGDVYARHDDRGQRRRGSGLHARRPGLGNRFDDQERRRMPSRLRGDGGRDRRKPAQDSSIDDYNDWPARRANRHSYASWESYDRDRDEDVAYVRDRPLGAAEAFEIGRDFRRRGVRAKRKTRGHHDLYPSSEERNN
ncbi:hypothetical protein HPB50_009138 [Hyalomma asiaticum]|uniref:Uncharacterized protein n=1 Tax=Hyalomma asiaticum TaxID=266040 RepID=A0ACB7SUL5_HYAAI|nr:hypothetical protein HPB50_009138 [Hyalomma asiaticum]